MNGLLITSEGIDGSGKGVVIDAWANYLVKTGLKLKDIRCPLKVDKEDDADVRQEFDFYPRYSHEEDLRNLSKAYIVCEPTNWGLGRTIRQELIRKDISVIYPAYTIAAAYATDRAVLYNRFILPALRDMMERKIILQDRSVASSFAYQPLDAEFQGQDLSLETIMAMYGNKIALSRVPDLMVIAMAPADVAAERTNSREKKDQCRFEDENFQERLQKNYTSKWLRDTFESRGTKVVYLDTNNSIEETQSQAVQILEDFLKARKVIE